MRKQYYFRPSASGLLAWDVDRLVRLSKHLQVKRVPLTDIRELDDPWDSGDEQTWRAVAGHIKLIEEASLEYPIILSASGAVMDGMHRVIKALMNGLPTIEAVQFETDPEPDHVGKNPNDLPYD